MRRIKANGVARAAAWSLAFVFSAVCAIAFDLGDLGINVPKIDLGSLLGQSQERAITTGLENAKMEIEFLDIFEPVDIGSIQRLSMTDDNEFYVNRPGVFQFEARTYCLHAGTHGPTKGDGYLLAPLQGPKADIIHRIARNSADHLDIPQQQIQTLIWGIQAKTKISDMGPELQAAAAKLLTPDDIASLNGWGMDAVSEEVRNQLLGQVSGALRPIMEAEYKLNSMISQANAPFEELEQVAVLAGDVTPPEGSRDVPSGRWNYHPNGYFMRFYPHGYSHTTIQIYNPMEYKITRDDEGRISAISDTVGNRMEVVYDETSDALVLPDDASVKAYKIKEIQLLKVRRIGTEMFQPVDMTLENPGWTFVGVPSEAGSIEASVDDTGFDGLKERYDRAMTVKYQGVDLYKNVKSYLKEEVPGDNFQLRNEDLSDLSHLAMAVQAATSQSCEEMEEWAQENRYMPIKAWSGELVSVLHVPEETAVEEDETEEVTGLGRGVLVACVNLQGILPVGANYSSDFCDNLDPMKPFKPQKGDGGKIFDPGGWAATPGNTGKQRLLLSPAGKEGSYIENPDCDKVEKLRVEMEKIRNAFKNTIPRAGESGADYVTRVEGALGYVQGDPEGNQGTAFAPMYTRVGSCVIMSNKDYYATQPDIMAHADCAHEKVHRNTCRWARDHVAGGYGIHMSKPANYRKDELKAYQAGMDMIDNWMVDNGCNP